MTAAVSPGRPRDPQVDERVADAAISIFGESGWAGFNVELVARRAGVGKASIYLRWSTKEELLLDALRRHVTRLEQIKPSDVRQELITLATQLLLGHVGDAGRAALRISLEAEQIPGIAEHWRVIKENQVLAIRAIVRRAIRRGELPPSTSVTLLLDALTGATLSHVLATPPSRRDQLARSAPRYAQELVDFLLARSRDAATAPAPTLPA
jgi:AcrR family transcriptional regulator